jgi:helicase
MTLLHLIALTDDITHYYKTADNEIILQVFHAHEKELVKLKELIPRQFSNAGDVSDPIKFADILRQWITEIKEPIIADDWGVGEGDVHSIVEQSKRVASALYMIAELQKNDSITTLARVLSVRINKGIKTELIGLTKIKGIGRAYARRLYNAKIATEQKYNELKSSDPELIKSILHPKKDKPALKIPIPTSDAASKKKLVRINEQVLLSSYGKHPTGAK